MTSIGKKRLGEILCEEGFLSESQLEESLKKQSSYPETRLLGHVLMDLGYITPEQLCDAVQVQTKCRV